MKKFILKKRNYKKQLSFTTVSNIDTFAFYKNSMQNLIDYFNKEYSWDKMFNIDDVEDRIKNGDRLFLLRYDNVAIGYVFFKHIDEQTCFGYNLYVTKIVDRPSDAALWFYNEVSGVMLNLYEFIEVEVEEWNRAIIDIIKNIGYYERRSDNS